MARTTIAKLNLKAHVAPKDEKHPGAVSGIRLGDKGTESTDGYSVFLRVPYPVMQVTPRAPDRRGQTLPLADCDAMAKAVNTPAATLRKEPERGHVVVDVRSNGVTWTGQNKDGGGVVMSGEAHGTQWPDTDHLPVDRSPDRSDLVLTLGAAALEKLLKASKALGAEGVEVRLPYDDCEADWSKTDAGHQRAGPMQLRLLDKDAEELARGAITPVIR